MSNSMSRNLVAFLLLFRNRTPASSSSLAHGIHCGRSISETPAAWWWLGSMSIDVGPAMDREVEKVQQVVHVHVAEFSR